jgi:O-antigen/teichoic acid export membrane protein
MEGWARHIKNALWLLSDRGLALVLGFFVSAYVARVYGPETFGIYSYGLALVYLFAVPGHAGLNALVVKRLVDAETDNSVIMGTSLVIKGLGFLVGLLLLLGFAFFPGMHTPTEQTLLAIMCLSLLIQPGYVLDFWFQAHYKARYQALSKQIALVVASGMKVTAAAMGASILWIAGATVMQALLSVVFLVLFYLGTTSDHRQRWRFDSDEAVSLLKQGGVVFLGTFFAAIYLKVDQIMLKMLRGDAEVGVYAVAATVSEAFYFIPVAITAAVFPRLIELRSENPKTYQYRTQQLLDGMAVLALLLAILITLVAAPLISTVFGSQYSGAALILSIHIWAAVFIFMRAVFSKWIVAEGLIWFSVITQGTGAVVNVALNTVLIPSRGALGAALATLLSYAAASYLALAFFPSTRGMFVMMTLALLAPFRYLSRKPKLSA